MFQFQFHSKFTVAYTLLKKLENRQVYKPVGRFRKIKPVNPELFMIVNYFKTAIRNIRRYRVHSILNITGLAVGIACTILILLWVRYELSFERYHEHADRIYRLATEFHFGTLQGKYAVSNNAPGPTLDGIIPKSRRRSVSTRSGASPPSAIKTEDLSSRAYFTRTIACLTCLPLSCCAAIPAPP